MILRLLPALLLMFSFLPVAFAKEDGYIYVKASLGFPWFMFLVFTVLILIPFLLVVFLAWRKPPEDESQDQPDQTN